MNGFLNGLQVSVMKEAPKKLAKLEEVEVVEEATGDQEGGKCGCSRVSKEEDS